MTGDALFAVIFIFAAMTGLYIATFFELGGDRIIGEKIIELIDSHNKKKDI